MMPEIRHEGFTSRWICAAGLRTHYLEGGEGPPLILMHGGGAGADGWGNWRACLSAYERHFHVIVPDMPGFGRTDKPDPAVYDYSQENRTAHLLALIAALGLDQVDLIGNSMGGATALGAAMKQPSAVRRLVLMGSAGLAIANPDRSALQDLAEYDHSLEGMWRIVKALTGPRFVPDEQIVQYRHALMQDPAAKNALKAIVASKLSYEREAIAAVKTPTLVVGGKEDKVAILARTWGYLELLENSWGFIVPHAGHWVMIEAPEQFVAVTTAFLRNQAFQ